MKPILFTIGNFNVYAFGFFLFFAFLISTFILYQLAKEEFKEEEYFDAFLYTSIVGIISSRIGFILMHFNTFGANILRYILVRETPGLSILAGLVGAIIFLYWYTRAYKLPFIHLLDIFSIVSAFALGLSKIGQQLGGAGFGSETTFFLSVQMVGRTGKFHPVELYEAILFFGLFSVLFFLYRKIQREKWPVGFIGCLYAVSVALIIFLLEFLKTHTVYLYGLSFRQLLALGGLVIVAKPTIERIIKIIRQRRGKYEISGAGVGKN
jgi:prolipoprotein diacylglyceryltransferase